MTDAPQATLRLRQHRLEFTVVDGEAVVLDLKTSEYFAVNETGTALWEALRHGATQSELLAILRANGAPADVATADLAAFLGELRARGLLDDASIA